MFYNIPSVAAHLYVKKLKVKGAKMPKSFFFDIILLQVVRFT